MDIFVNGNSQSLFILISNTWFADLETITQEKYLQV